MNMSTLIAMVRTTLRGNSQAQNRVLDAVEYGLARRAGDTRSLRGVEAHLASALCVALQGFEENGVNGDNSEAYTETVTVLVTAMARISALREESTEGDPYEDYDY
jgi:hypothetical protein